MLLNGAIPLPFAIIIKGLFYVTENVDSKEFILRYFGFDFKKVEARPFFTVEMHRSKYYLLFFTEARV